LKNAILLIVFVVFVSCKKEAKTTPQETSSSTNIPLKYAKGFSITNFGSYKVIEIKNPWPNAEETYEFILADRKADIDWKTERLENNIKYPIQKIVVTSTTHIPALELLGVEQTLVGFPGTDYVSSEKVRKRIDEGFVRELGKNEGINTEILLELKPDVVVGFGVDGVNKTFETIQKANIPVIYNGDWVEASPLAKAEWIKFFGVLYNKEKQADSIFNTIEANYLEAKKLASSAKTKPTVLSGALHKDVWYLPNGTSTEAQFLKDANVTYLWSETSGKGSLALSFESVFEKAKDAELWLSPSYYKSLEAIKKANQHYTKFKAFQNNKVYSFSNTTGKTGGVLYYELGIARPDLVLKDIIKICHPELLENYQPYFFKPLH
jgi:cobalamin transport system substrate-binding protein